MSSQIFSEGKWICPQMFAKEEPIDVFHKEREKKEIALPESLKHLHMLTRKRFFLEKPEDGQDGKIITHSWALQVGSQAVLINLTRQIQWL